MRIVLSDFMSLDGVVQAPGGPDEDRDGGFAHGGWSMPFFDLDTMGPAFDATIADAEALLYGRRTWETMAAAWPERAGDPFADRLNALPKYVVSATLQPDDLTWENSHLVDPGTLVRAVEDLRVREGGDVLVMGSSELARTLLRHDLVDELRLMIEPLLLGGGKRLFPEDGVARTFDLVDVAPAATGVLVCTYRRRPDA